MQLEKIISIIGDYIAGVSVAEFGWYAMKYVAYSSILNDTIKDVIDGKIEKKDLLRRKEKSDLIGRAFKWPTPVDFIAMIYEMKKYQNSKQG